MEADFSGYATKVGLKCSDGRTIMRDAFASQDGSKVPLVWQHNHHDASNVLGHALLENRNDGVYAYGFFNETDAGQNAKALVRHGDINAMSIYANNLVEKSHNVMHGQIREVSLVLSGANPGALIDNVNIRHSDGYLEELPDEAIITTGLALKHEDDANKTENDSNTNNTNEENNMAERTVQDVFDAMSEEQKNVVYFMIGTALEEAGVDTGAGDDDEDTAELEQSAFGPDSYITHKEAFEMTRNVFEMAANENAIKHSNDRPQLDSDEVKAIVHDAQKVGSFKEAVLMHADKYGIENIDYLFPDARTITNTPEYLKRRTEWVDKVLGGIKKSPFTRIKSIYADITADEARARGFVKGNRKKEEIIKLLKRTTEPTTIYKKQKLDRDDIIDITDLDVVAWIKGEMRLMLDEEIARAILIGDGREYGDDDKIDETKIRPIAYDDDMYAHQVEVDSHADAEAIIEAMIRARSAYKGSSQPTLFTTLPFLTDMLLVKNKIGDRVYESKEDLANALMAKEIVEVEVMEDTNILGIYVNLPDYTAGADKGGEVSMFDDFDIDYNQYKYLIETRMSGSLTKPKSAVVINRAAGEKVTPISPSFDSKTNTVKIPTIKGVVYTIDGVEVTGDKKITVATEVQAKPASNYAFPANTVTHWTFVPTEG